MPNWTMPIAFSIKVFAGFIFSYVYIYSVDKSAEPSDAMRFLSESEQLYKVYFKSKSDFFALLTGIGDTGYMIKEHMKGSFIWDAGNFTLINDSRNTIRIHSLIHFISFGVPFVHTLIMCTISLIGIQQLYIAFQPFSNLKPIFLFGSLLLFPSLLFWSSSILKEPLLILGMGILARGLFFQGALFHKTFYIGLGFLLLLLFKPYILMCLLLGIMFFIAYKYIFRFHLGNTIIASLAISLLLLLSFPKKIKKITVDLSRKQFEAEIVGKGGMYVVDVGKNRFFFFKPHQYKNLKITNNFVEIIHPTDAIIIPDVFSKTPFDTTLTKIGKKSSIHKIEKGTNSYIKTTSINNSTIQLLKNIPEALINAFFRPFPFDKGNFLKYPAMMEVWMLTVFLLISIYFRKKIDAQARGIIFSLLIFSFGLLILIGWTTPVAGAIVRFRVPAQITIFLIGGMLIDPIKLKNKIIK